ncbi:MAG TPA: hypothetical protein VIG99_17460 [Myxococcaceae bacterium]|jgi:hypothetical protein
MAGPSQTTPPPAQPSAPPQDPSQQPGGDPDLEFGPRAPSMPQYFLGYAVVFGAVIGFALLLVGLMRFLR